MKRFLRNSFPLLLAAGLVAIPFVLMAQDKAEPNAEADAGKPAEEIKVSDMTLADLMIVLASPEDALPPEMQDPAFRKYVDVSLLSVAWGDLNAVLMTDIALQLQEGERILRRPHHAIASADLLQAAAKIAGENKDDATLARIKSAAEADGNKELIGQVAMAAKLGGTARDMTPSLQVPVDQIDAADLADLQGFLLAVRAARLGGDAKVLESLRGEVDKLEGVPSAQIESLKKTIDDSLMMVKQAGKVDPTVDTLEKIRGATRDFIGHFGHGSFHGHFGGHGGHGGGHFGGHFGGGHGHYGGHWGGGHSGYGGGHWGGHWGGHGGHGGGHWGGSHHGHH